MAESNKQGSTEEKKEKGRSFLTRLISAIVLIVFGGGCVVFGGIPLTILLMFISIRGTYELLRVFRLEKTALAPVTYIGAFVYDVLLYFRLEQFEMPMIILLFLVLLTVYVITFPKFDARQIMSAFFSFFYLCLGIGFVYKLRGLENGILFAILILVVCCGNDIFAYLTGILIGKHKMFPRLSPKKSVEGFIGGIVGAAVCGGIYGYVFHKFADYGDYNYVVVFAVVSAIAALPAVVGDLAASAIKRNCEIKDYGRIIPGHGGVMDRFDSMIFTAPIIYYLVTFILDIQA